MVNVGHACSIWVIKLYILYHFVYFSPETHQSNWNLLQRKTILSGETRMRWWDLTKTAALLPCWYSEKHMGYFMMFSWVSLLWMFDAIDRNICCLNLSYFITCFIFKRISFLMFWSVAACFGFNLVFGYRTLRNWKCLRRKKTHREDVWWVVTHLCGLDDWWQPEQVDHSSENPAIHEESLFRFSNDTKNGIT